MTRDPELMFRGLSCAIFAFFWLTGPAVQTMRKGAEYAYRYRWFDRLFLFIGTIATGASIWQIFSSVIMTILVGLSAGLIGWLLYRLALRRQRTKAL